MPLTYRMMSRVLSFSWRNGRLGRTLIGRCFPALCSAHGRIHHQTSLLLISLDSYGLLIVACEIPIHVIHLGFEKCGNTLQKINVGNQKVLKTSSFFKRRQFGEGGIDAAFVFLHRFFALVYQKDTIRLPHSRCLLPLLAPTVSSLHLFGHHTRLGYCMASHPNFPFRPITYPRV